LKRVTQHFKAETAWILCAAALAGLAFDFLRMPVAWMLGPMAAGVFIALVSGRSRPFPDQLQQGAQMVLGLSTALTFTPDAITLLGSQFPALLVTIVIIGALSMANGWLLYRHAGIDRASGFLGSIPGAAGAMVAMSQEVGADARVVAVLQYLRLLTVAFLSPLIVKFLIPPEAAVPDSTPSRDPVALLPDQAGLLLLLLAGLAGGWLGRRVRLPAANFLGPLLVTLLCNWTGLVRGPLPRPVFLAALLAIGVGVGIRFDWPTLRGLRRAALIAFVEVLALMAASIALGYGLAWMAGIELSAAILGTMPGAMEAQIASAVGMGVNAPLVVSMHLVRVLLLIVAGPWIAQRLATQGRSHGLGL
jgi:membrane AbrB-like protein